MMNSRQLLFTSLCFFVAVVTTAEAKDATYPETLAWGRIATTKSTVELHVNAIPKSHTIALPRFNNSYKHVYLKSDTKKAELKVKVEVNEWLVTLPKSVGDTAIVVIETVGTPQLLAKPYVNEANAKGEFTLPACHAEVHGKKLRFEPQPHKNTVGYWTVADDWCEWKIKVTKPGDYDVQILQGCGKGQGGSEVAVKIGDRSLTFVVEDTGHFQNFKERALGTLTIKEAGELSLQIRPLKKAKAAVMDVRQLRLVPKS